MAAVLAQNPTPIEPQALAAGRKPREPVPYTNMEQFSVTCSVGDGIIPEL